MQSPNDPDLMSGAEAGTEAGTAPEPVQNYPPRVCRICLETVLPTFQPSEFFQRPRVVYESTDPESGRLLRPCKCKGSARYVHEGCLQTWRLADPRYGARNFWQCPTCGFQYRLQRLTWARWISSAGTQLLLTLGILFFTVFLLGFVADPILDLYLGPLEDVYVELDEELDSEVSSWIAHLFKGLASLGVLSFFRAIWGFSPFWGSRGGIMGGRTTARGRARDISWLVLLIGVGSFLWVCSLTLYYQFLTHMLRPSTKVSGPGVDEPLRELARESWTFLCQMTRTTRSQQPP